MLSLIRRSQHVHLHVVLPLLISLIPLTLHLPPFLFLGFLFLAIHILSIINQLYLPIFANSPTSSVMLLCSPSHQYQFLPLSFPTNLPYLVQPILFSYHTIFQSLLHSLLSLHLLHGTFSLQILIFVDFIPCHP
jgi:hypothetical protein